MVGWTSASFFADSPARGSSIKERVEEFIAAQRNGKASDGPCSSLFCNQCWCMHSRSVVWQVH